MKVKVCNNISENVCDTKTTTECTEKTEEVCEDVTETVCQTETTNKCSWMKVKVCDQGGNNWGQRRKGKKKGGLLESLLQAAGKALQPLHKLIDPRAGQPRCR